MFRRCYTRWSASSWISRNRRLARGFERSATTVASFIRLAMIRIMLGDLLQMPRHESKRALHAGSLGNS
jgi:hypothetical protein